MAFFSQHLLATFLLFVSLFHPALTSPVGGGSLAVRDDRAEVSRILQSLGAIATAFCSNYLHLQDATITSLSPGSTSVAYVTVVGIAPTITAPGGTSIDARTTTLSGAVVTTVVTHPGDVIHLSITPSPNVLQQTQNLPASTVTSTVTLPALTSTVQITNGGATNLVTSTNPAATNTMDITLAPVTITQGEVTTETTTSTVSTTTVTSTTTATSTSYTFVAGAKRAVTASTSTKPAAIPSAKLNGIAGLQKLAASYISSGCSQIAHPSTKTVTSRGANAVQTITQTAAGKAVTVTAPAVHVTQIVTVSSPGAIITLSTRLAASTDVTTLAPGVVTVTVTTQLPAVTVTANTQLAEVFQTQTVQLPDSTSYIFVNPPPVTVANTVNPLAVTVTTTATTTTTVSTVYTTTSLATATATTTVTNPPGACQQTVYTSKSGYGVLGEVRQQNVNAANTLECCQKCFMSSGCQVYAYFPPGQGDLPQCALYSNGYSPRTIKTPTCPAGTYTEPNDPRADTKGYTRNYQGPGPCGVLG